jgi:uncharacterized protein
MGSLLQMAGGRYDNREDVKNPIAGALSDVAAKPVAAEDQSEAARQQREAAAAAAKPFRVLVLDGGGINGLAQVRALAELEERTGKPASEHFDLMVGTSTGGLISLALAARHPDDPNKPLMTAKELVKFYEDQGPKIFGTRDRRNSGIHWSEKPLEDFLKSKFGDMKIQDTRIPVMVSAMDNDRGEAVWLRNLGPAYQKKNDPNPRLWQAARATSAAPTKFKPAKVDMGEGQEPRYRNLIDGGVFANMPAMEAYIVAEGMAKDIGGGREVEMLSIGTGAKRFTMSSDRISSTGAFGWAIDIFRRISPIRELAEQGKETSADKLLQDKLGDRYHRWDMPLTNSVGRKFSPSGSMDDASRGNLVRLKMVAEDFIWNNWDKVEALADRFAPGRTAKARPAQATAQELDERLKSEAPPSPGLLAWIWGGLRSPESRLLASGPDAVAPKNALAREASPARLAAMGRSSGQRQERSSFMPAAVPA